MKDREGNIIKVGDKFIYHINKIYKCTGEVFDCGGVEVIKWDNNEIISVKDFYHEPTDKKIIQKVF